MDFIKVEPKMTPALAAIFREIRCKPHDWEYSVDISQLPIEVVWEWRGHNHSPAQIRLAMVDFEVAGVPEVSFMSGTPVFKFKSIETQEECWWRIGRRCSSLKAVAAYRSDLPEQIHNAKMRVEQAEVELKYYPWGTEHLASAREHLANLETQWAQIDPSKEFAAKLRASLCEKYPGAAEYLTQLKW